MIRRSTVVYIIVLLVVAGAYLILDRRAQQAGSLPPSEPTEEISFLFSAEDGVPTSIRLQAGSGETVQVARNAEGAWALDRPVEAAAKQGEAESAASQVTTMRILNRTPQIDLAVVGLTDPAYVLTVKFNSGTERTANIGVVTPTESGYYVQDASGGDVLIVSKSAVDALLRLLTNPPYLETPTPRT